jgi:ABC-type nickel/cobalt efflux system permease component RcnA
VRRALAALAVVGAFLLLPASASAHPLGNFTVNLYAGIQLTPGEVRVDHVVDMAEIPTVQVTPEIDSDGDGILSDAERSGWAASTAAEVAANLVLTVDGERVALEVVSAAVELRPGQGGLDVLRLESTFAGVASESGDLRFRDENFAGRVGWREVTATGTDGAIILRSSVPARSVTDRLLSYPQDSLSSPLDVREAVVTFEPGVVSAVGRDGGPVFGARPAATGGAFADLAGGGPPMLLALVLAFAFGALHALGPGHGKTLMAAYLVGAGGRARQAVAVGGAVAVMHTASVLALGLVVLGATELFAPERVYPWLGLSSGLIAFGLGAGLLVSRLGAWGARADRPGDRDAEDPVDPDGHDHHGHAHPHANAVPEGILSRRGIAALAVAGGILPSPTALVVLLATIALDRLAYGLGLIAAFSLGLAAALVVVGIVALRAREVVFRRMSSRFANALPVLSASAIAVAGIVLAVRAFAEI